MSEYPVALICAIRDNEIDEIVYAFGNMKQAEEYLDNIKTIDDFYDSETEHMILYKATKVKSRKVVTTVVTTESP